MRRGYARRLGEEDGLEAQVVALTAFGCEELLVEQETGEQARMRVDEYLYNLRAGEELVVERLEALGRTTGKLVVILEDLLKRGVAVTALEPARLTLSPDGDRGGRALLDILARHEEARMDQRYGSGSGGGRNARRYKLDRDQTAEALERFNAGESLASIARALGVESRVVSAALSGLRTKGVSDGGLRRRRTSLQPRPAFEITRLGPRAGGSGDGG